VVAKGEPRDEEGEAEWGKREREVSSQALELELGPLLVRSKWPQPSPFLIPYNCSNSRRDQLTRSFWLNSELYVA